MKQDFFGKGFTTFNNGNEIRYLPSYNQIFFNEEESVIDLTAGMMLSVEIE